MTFKDIAIKNFKGNMRKYLAYYLCNSFIVATFVMYSTLIFNEKLWTTKQIEKGVLEALIVPNVALGIFSLFFISYAHGLFIKWRKREFGLFMNLGMTVGDIRKIIVCENVIIALGAILLGFLTGVVFSRLFFIVITGLLEVKDISFVIGIKNFAYSGGIFLGIYLINLLITLITTYSFEIINLLKAQRKIENNRVNSLILALVGFCIVIFSVMYLYKWFDDKNQSRVLLEATILIPIGVYMIISQLGGALTKLCKKRKSIYYKNLLLVTNINKKFKETKKIIFITFILVTVVIFYTGFMFGFCMISEKYAIIKNNYDVFYAEIRDKNKLSQEKVEEIVSKNNEKIKEHETLEFIYYVGTNDRPDEEIIMTDSEINKLGKIKLKVDNGKYILLHQQEDISDEVKEEYKKINLKLRFNGLEYEFINQQSVLKDLFRSTTYAYSSINVVNEETYNFIKSQNQGYEMGKFNLYNFNNWKNTKPIVDDLKSELDKANKNTKPFNSTLKHYEENRLKISSRISSYNYDKQGARLLLVTSGYLGTFFFIAIAVVLFLKLLSDIDSDKERFKRMYKIGITDREIRKSIGNELKPVFFIGPIIGIIIGVIYTITINQDGCDESFKKYFIYADIIVSIIVLVIQTSYYFICKKVYCDEILEEISN